VYAAGTEKTAQRLVEELELLGMTVEAERRTTDGTFPTRPDADAIVVVRGDRSVVLHLTADDGKGHSEKVEVPRNPGDSDDLVALRAAEELRGTLLETEPDATRTDSPPAAYRVSLTAGAALFARTYARPTVGFIADGAYWLHPRWGVGPYFMNALSRDPWRIAPDQFTLTHFSLGAQGRGILYESGGTGFELQALARVGGRALTLYGETGKPTTRFHGSSAAFELGAGIEANYALTSWFVLGAQASGTLGLPLAWPRASSDLKNPERKALEEADESGPDGLFGFAAHATLRF
jgi:hypothetical protein